MNVLEMLAELRTERGAIEEAMIALERLARGTDKRRGRPPAWMTAAKSRHLKQPGGGTIKKRMFGAAARERMAAAQRKRWAAKKNEQGVEKAS